MHIQLKQVVPYPLKGLFDPQTQVWDKELDIETTKKYKIFAPSGKGKSTFVNTVYGLRHDYTGSVHYDGKNIITIQDDHLSKIRQNQLSIIFQDLRLFDHLTARENIEVKKSLNKPPVDYEVLAEKFGVEKLLDKQASVLSYGERQRIAIIRALIQPFDFLLMDEPFSHLDEGNIRIACEEIKRVCEINKAGYLICSLGYDYFLEYDEKLRL